MRSSPLSSSESDLSGKVLRPSVNGFPVADSSHVVTSKCSTKCCVIRASVYMYVNEWLQRATSHMLMSWHCFARILFVCAGSFQLRDLPACLEGKVLCSYNIISLCPGGKACPERKVLCPSVNGFPAADSSQIDTSKMLPRNNSH